MSKNFTEKKRHRLLKVIFIIAFLIVFTGSITAVFSNAIPHTDYYNSTYFYKCYSGEVRGPFSYSDLSNLYYSSDSLEKVDFLSDNDKKVTRAICSNGKFFDNLSREDKAYWIADVLNNNINNVSKVRNYEFVFKDEKMSGTWLGFVGKLLAAFWGSIIGFTLIRYLYYYVLLGEHKYIFNEFKDSNDE